MSDKTKISIFATKNDLNKWAVCVDGYFGLFETKDEAIKVYNKIGGTGGDDGLAETYFGSCELLPPNCTPMNAFNGTEMTKSVLSEKLSIDIERYITLQPKRFDQKFISSTRGYPWDGKTTAKQRLQDKRVLENLFGENFEL